MAKVNLPHIPSGKVQTAVRTGVFLGEEPTPQQPKPDAMELARRAGVAAAQCALEAFADSNSPIPPRIGVYFDSVTWQAGARVTPEDAYVLNTDGFIRAARYANDMPMTAEQLEALQQAVLMRQQHRAEVQAWRAAQAAKEA